MSGSIRCANNDCRRARNENVCPHCGNSSVCIVIYFKGKHYTFRRNNHGRVLRDIAEAKDIHAEMRLAINKNKFNPLDYTASKIDERMFAHQVEAWLEQKKQEVEAGELSPETLKDYKGYAKNYFSFFNEYNAREITFEHLENFKDSLPHSLRIKTRRNVLNALHSLFVRMHKKGVITEMPAWPSIEGDDSCVRSALTYEEQMDGLSKIPETDRDVIEFGFETGLRPGETCALKVKDVDELRRRILVQRTWSGSHLIERTKGKNKKWLSLSDRAWEIIRPRIKSSLPEAFIFINNRTGREYRQKVLNRIWRTYSGHGDLDHYSASRHSFCTQLVHDGVNLLEAQAAMRHGDIRSTERYFHPDSDKMRGIFNRRGRAVSQDQKGHERDTKIKAVE